MDYSARGTESAIVPKQSTMTPLCLLDILAIPELAEVVLDYLSPAHIRQLRLVSSQLCKACRPHFFITLDISSYESLTDVVSLDKCGYLVRSIELRRYTDTPLPHIYRYCHSSLTSLSLGNLSNSAMEDFDTLLHALPNLQHSRSVARLGTGLRSLSVKNGPIVSLPLKWESLISVLAACTKLRALALANVSFVDDSDPVYLDWINSTSTEPLPGASRVGIHTPTGDLSELDQGHVALQHLSQHSQHSFLYQDQLQQDHHPAFSRVHSLELSSCEMELQHIRGFIYTLPALSSLQLHFGSGVWAPLFLSSLGQQSSFPSLRCLKLSSFSLIEQPVLVGFLRCTPYLQDLSITGEWVNHENSLLEIVEVCKAVGIRFRRLQLLGYGGFPLHEVPEFLKSECCQDLEELELEQSASCVILERLIQVDESITTNTPPVAKSAQIPATTNSLSPATPTLPPPLDLSTCIWSANENNQLPLKANTAQPTQDRPCSSNTSTTTANNHQTITSFAQSTPTSPVPRDLTGYAWFPFSKSLTSLRLTGGTQLIADQRTTLALNRILRQLPRLVDLAIGMQLQSYDLFEGLGWCPSTHYQTTALGNVWPNFNDSAESASRTTSEPDCTSRGWLAQRENGASWLNGQGDNDSERLNERPLLQTLSVSIARQLHLHLADLEVQIVQRFRLLDDLQLTVDGDLTRYARAWRRSLRPGLKVEFTMAPPLCH
ncbi:hypothetical protein BGW38_006005 [Lunasporangiospora selenospora]|uniref:F-box domain-containing protein n=1 Tax=Lunasporangiospora selenospora TaxID=979761 RepID=A0A9P6FN40_9FUNG|nr:hypothetical protein BGW38_006005 [Lunasporangiospora selenospora]